MTQTPPTEASATAGSAGTSKQETWSSAPQSSGSSDAVKLAAGDWAIEAEGLCKYYGSFTAVENVTFQIPRGRVTAFLGPNGACKSTTMKILTGFLAPSKGRARILGKDVFEHRLEVARQIGFLPENGPLYMDMTPRSFLNFVGEIRGLSAARLRERIAIVTEMCSLQTVFNKTIRKLSKGFKQRVGLAQALLHDPEVLILDEPTAGLDPNQIQEVRKLIKNLGQAKSILLSTHILQEVEAMADHVLFIADGRLAFDGDLNAYTKRGKDLDTIFHQLSGSEAR
ncbi:MAG TPA: ATP-binding cassette domain-containing protein [Planctomycetota bacterium]|nr:ATP-binding cassette domain-containing protein [Planctomycetota bacterium]